jgi:hypothetical protein
MFAILKYFFRRHFDIFALFHVVADTPISPVFFGTAAGFPAAAAAAATFDSA